MTSIALGRGDVVVGVDTHKDEHVAVALDGLGGRLGELAIAARPDGYAELLALADELGAVSAFGVEGTGSYGSGLARFLRRHARKVIEVSRPPRKGERRMSGKSDTIDAEHAAREVLAGTATATPKLADGIVESIRLVKIARDSAVKARSQAMITLKATLVTASDEMRCQLEPRSDFKLIAACAELDTGGDVADPTTAMRQVLASLAQRWLELHTEIKTHTRSLEDLTRRAAPDLVDASASGPTPQRRCSSPPATTPTASTPRLPSPSSAARARSLPGPARPAAVTASTEAATAKPTPRSTASSSCACDGTHRPSPTSSGAPPKASPRRRSSAA